MSDTTLSPVGLAPATLTSVSNVVTDVAQTPRSACIVREALRLLEEREQARKAKLRALREAAKQAFDKIDQGSGIILNGKKALGRFFEEIQDELLT